MDERSKALYLTNAYGTKDLLSNVYASGNVVLHWCHFGCEVWLNNCTYGFYICTRSAK